MKKLINDPKNVVDEMLEGLVLAFPDKIRRIPEWNVIVRRDAPVKGKVALLSGGGSGHEPAFAGYIGKGMIDGSACGFVFASPTPPQIYEGIKAIDGGLGVIQIYNNYAGDVMNFDTAQDMARAEGIRVETVTVNDDVAIDEPARRRGIAGNFFIHKVAGAKAEQRASFDEALRIAKKGVANLRGMGIALTSCTVPEKGKPTFEIAEDEMEIGMGVHGEPGVQRTKTKPANEVVDVMVGRIIEDFNKTIGLKKGDEVAVMVNSLGQTPPMELLICFRRVHQICKDKGIKIYKPLIGEYMTSLEMAGMSIDFLKLDKELKELLDYPADYIALMIR